MVLAAADTERSRVQNVTVPSRGFHIHCVRSEADHPLPCRKTAHGIWHAFHSKELPLIRNNYLASAASVALLAAVCGCGASSSKYQTNTGGAPPAAVSATPGYIVTTFATSSSAGKSTNPDSIIQVGSNIFVGYGDSTNPDGTAPGSNPPVAGQTEIIEYSLTGKAVKTFEVTGHNDGLLAYDSHTIWSMSNEDANPTLTVIDLSAGTQTQYTPTTPLLHGGGLDDMQLIGGAVYVSASNPDTSAPTNQFPNGIVTGAPAAISIALNANGKTFDWKPVLNGNAQATNIAGGGNVTLNLTDPDSEATDPSGNLVLDSQGDSELVFISNPGAGNQTAKVLPLTLNSQPWQVDDTRFVPKGNAPYLLVTDTPTNTIYRVDANFNAGDAYSAGEGNVLKLNTTTGVFTAVVSGLGSAHGMLFVTQ